MKIFEKNYMGNKIKVGYPEKADLQRVLEIIDLSELTGVDRISSQCAVEMAFAEMGEEIDAFPKDCWIFGAVAAAARRA